MKDLSREELITKYINLCEVGKEAISSVMDELSGRRAVNWSVVNTALIVMERRLSGYKI